MFQQFSGINVLMFFSTTLLNSAVPTLTGQQISLLINSVNFVTGFGGMALLNYFGRKTLMVFG